MYQIIIISINESKKFYWVLNKHHSIVRTGLEGKGREDIKTFYILRNYF